MHGSRTVEVRIRLDDELHELLIAELSDLDFYSFTQEEEYLLAYIEARRWTDVARETIERWLEVRGLLPVLDEREYAPQNWDRQWEETVKPVSVGRFFIKPTWCDVPDEAEGRILLEIDPKMSFGTGYHESTRLMLQMMPDFVRQGATVMDAGTGTGVLAIAAAKLGAASVAAFDIDSWSYVNATENTYLNGVADRVNVVEGEISDVPAGPYDVVLANINRNTLLDLLPALRQRLSPGGTALLAGLLHTDREIVERKAASLELHPVDFAEENEWVAVAIRRESESSRAGSVA